VVKNCGGKREGFTIMCEEGIVDYGEFKVRNCPSREEKNLSCGGGKSRRVRFGGVCGGGGWGVVKGEGDKETKAGGKFRSESAEWGKNELRKKWGSRKRNHRKTEGETRDMSSTRGGGEL